VTCIDISYDGLRIASGCATASIGVLNVASHAYSTVLRAHSGSVNCVALGFDVDEHGASRIFATAGDDRTVRVWSLETLEQLYEFDAPGERPQVRSSFLLFALNFLLLFLYSFFLTYSFVDSLSSFVLLRSASHSAPFRSRARRGSR
jgi:WD40 repeat protein